MRANASWDNADRSIVYFELLQDWSWRDLSLAVQRAERLAHESNRRIDLIIDMRGVPAPSHPHLFRLNVLATGRAFARLAACCPRQIVIVGAPDLIRAMIAHNYAACSVDRANIHFTDRPEQGRDLIYAEQRRAIIYDVVASA